MPSTSAYCPLNLRVWCSIRAPTAAPISAKWIGDGGSSARAASDGSIRIARANAFRDFNSVLPQRRQVGVHPLVGIDLIVDVFLQLVAVARQASLELRMVGEELERLAPGGLRLLGLVRLPV